MWGHVGSSGIRAHTDYPKICSNRWGGNEARNHCCVNEDSLTWISAMKIRYQAT